MVSRTRTLRTMAKRRVGRVLVPLGGMRRFVSRWKLVKKDAIKKREERRGLAAK